MANVGELYELLRIYVEQFQNLERGLQERDV